MNLPMIGTSEKTDASRFQITLVDLTDATCHPMNYPRIHRFFDTIEVRNAFVEQFETSIIQAGGKLVHEVRKSHPLFESFTLVDNAGNKGYSLTVYR